MNIYMIQILKQAEKHKRKTYKKTFNKTEVFF